MQPDPYGGPQGDPNAQAGQTGTQPPQADPARQKELDDLKAENAKLREERRDDRAKALAAQHGLTPTETVLLKKLNADEMEKVAADLETERKAAAPPPGPSGQAPPPAVEPPNAGALAAMSSGGEGAPPVIETPAANTTDAMVREINQATSFEEVDRIQQKYKRMRSEEQQG